jgi:hypothetical protein
MNFNFFRKRKVAQVQDQLDQSISKNQEAIELFAKLEILASEQPDVFKFFLNKYGSEMLSYYNWGDALWRTDEQPVGALDKFLPYIGLVFQVIIIFMISKIK